MYQRAAFSVITSKSEAFAMSIVESIGKGTPVISYNCKYGPADIIDHNKNGILIKLGDVNGLAEAMIELFSNEKKRDTLSQEAKKASKKYQQEILAEKWNEVFESAIQQKTNK